MSRLSHILTEEGKIVKIVTSKNKAVKLRCVDCLGFVKNSIVKKCDDEDCYLFPYRLGTKENSGSKRNKAIKDYCSDCAGGGRKYIRKCSAINCPLYPHRIGAKQNEYIVKRVVRQKVATIKKIKRMRRK